MLASGHIIGKIVDDLATLLRQVELRNKINQYDLTLICENFFKDILNIVYNLDLENLNRERDNNPGIDLGSKKKQIAYQVTSTKTSAKVKKTLNSLTEDQLSDYNKVKIFIIGEKQRTYSIDVTDIPPKIDFNINEDIVDVKDLLKDIVILAPNILEELFSLFKSQFRPFIIDFEVVDKEGNYDSSLENKEEEIPNLKPNTATTYLKYLGLEGDYAIEELKNLLELYSSLSLLPRITREYLLSIKRRGSKISNRIAIQPKTLEHVLMLDKYDLMLEINLLLEKNLIEIEKLELGYSDFESDYIIISNQVLLDIFEWSEKENINLRKLINIMDWSVLD